LWPGTNPLNSMSQRLPRIEKALMAFLGLSLWIYLILRAVYVQPIYDEIATFYHYIHTNDFLPFLSHADANNHLLNSLLTWISYQLLGPSELALRLPNLLAFIVYALYTVRLSIELKNPALRWTLILALLFVHHLLEFFALTRGYGLSMALMVAACWHLIRFFRLGSTRHYFFVILFMGLAVLANLNLLYSYLIFFILSFLFLLMKKKGAHLFNVPHLLIFLCFLTLSLFCILYLMDLRKQGLLYYGSQTGIWGGTLTSLGNLLFGSNPLVPWYFAFLFATGLVILIVRATKNGWHGIWFDPATVIFIALTGNIAALVLGNKLLNINYQEARTALYLYPLLFIGIIQLMNGEEDLKRIKGIKWILFPIVLVPVHFFLQMNIDCVSFENERIPDRFFRKVEMNHSPDGYPPTLGGYRGREMQWAWLNYRNGGREGVVQSTDYPGDIADFQIIDPKIRSGLSEIYDSIDADDQTGFYLLKRISPSVRKPIAHYPVQVTSGWTTEEYYPISSGKVDTLQNRSLYAGYRLSIISHQQPFRAWVVITVFDKDRKTLCYERIPLDWLRDEWNDPDNLFIQGLYLDSIPSNAFSYTTYLWNIDQKPFRISEGSFGLFELVPE
jgi:hypothetical protein